jgi:hypothetical protein
MDGYDMIHIMVFHKWHTNIADWWREYSLSINLTNDFLMRTVRDIIYNCSVSKNKCDVQNLLVIFHKSLDSAQQNDRRMNTLRRFVRMNGYDSYNGAQDITYTVKAKTISSMPLYEGHEPQLARSQRH